MTSLFGGPTGKIFAAGAGGALGGAVYTRAERKDARLAAARPSSSLSKASSSSTAASAPDPTLPLHDDGGDADGSQAIDGAWRRILPATRDDVVYSTRILAGGIERTEVHVPAAVDRALVTPLLPEQRSDGASHHEYPGAQLFTGGRRRRTARRRASSVGRTQRTNERRMSDALGSHVASTWLILAAPLLLAATRKLWRRWRKHGKGPRRHAREEDKTKFPEIEAIREMGRAMTAEGVLEGNGIFGEIERLLRERDAALEELARRTGDGKRGKAKPPPAPSPVAAEALDRVRPGDGTDDLDSAKQSPPASLPRQSLDTVAGSTAGGATGECFTGSSSRESNPGRAGAQDVETVVLYQARELRYLRVTLAEKERRIDALTRSVRRAAALASEGASSDALEQTLTEAEVANVIMDEVSEMETAETAAADDLDVGSSLDVSLCSSEWLFPATKGAGGDGAGALADESESRQGSASASSRGASGDVVLADVSFSSNSDDGWMDAVLKQRTSSSGRAGAAGAAAAPERRGLTRAAGAKPRAWASSALKAAVNAMIDSPGEPAPLTPDYDVASAHRLQRARSRVSKLSPSMAGGPRRPFPPLHNK